MSIDVDQLNRTFEKHIAVTNALLAAVTGLVAQLKDSQGEEGVKLAQAKAAEYARQMNRQIGVKVDASTLNRVFNVPLA